MKTKAKRTKKTKPAAAPQQEAKPVVPKPTITIKAKGDFTKDFDRIFSEGVLFDLDIGYWTAMGRNTADELGISETPDYVIGLGMKRLVPKALMDEWRHTVAKARYIVRRHSFVFPIGQAAFVPVSSLPMIEEELEKLKAEHMKHADYVFRHFDKIRDDMMKEFPELRAYYTSREHARGMFYFTWSVYNVALPKKVQLREFNRKKAAEDDRALTRYRETLERRMQEFLADVVATMRQKVAETCVSITQKIKSGEVVTNGSLNTLRRFVERFKEMNFVGDATIADMLDRLMKDVLGDRDASQFADDKTLQRTLVTSLDALRATAEAVTDISEITGGYSRRIRV